MVSKNNFRNKLESEAKRVPHYGLRKLNIGVASILLGAGLYFTMPANVHADVPANTNQPVNTTEEVSFVANSAASSANKAISSAASNSTSALSESTATENVAKLAGSTSSSTTSVASSQASSTVASSSSAASGSATSTAAKKTASSAASKASENATSSAVTKSTKNVASSAASQTKSSAASQQTAQSSTSSAQSASSSAATTINVSSLASNATNAGSLNTSLFRAGTLDLSKWTTTVQNGYLMLTGYTGDKTHIVIPNEADFENAGLDPQHLQVGITRDVVRSIESSTTQSFEFSNTAGDKVKAIGDDWSTAFTAMPNVKNFDGSGLDTSGVSDFENMFNGAKLDDAGLSTLQNWDTSNATSMMNMFIGGTFTDLTPLSNWDTSKVHSMFNMFRQCANLSDLTPIAHWNTSSLTDLGLAFGDDQQLKTVDLSNWDLSKVTNFGGTFADTNPKIIVLVNNESVRSAIQSGISGSNAITIGSDKVAMPNVYVVNSTTTAHQAIVNAINQALANYRASHSDVHNLVPEQPLDSITNLQDLANVTFRNGISVTYHFVDDDNHEVDVGSPVTVSGNAGDNVSTGLTIPSGYVLAPGETLPATVTIGTTNSIVQIHLVHAISVSYQFVDDNENGAHVGAPITVSGAAGSTQSVSLTVPTNYALATGQTLPTSVTIGNTNAVVDIHLVHTYDYFASGPTETRTITHHWVYGDGPHRGENAAPDSIIEIYLTHMSRRDKVTGQVQKDLPYVVNGTTYLGDNSDMSYNFSSRWWPDTSKGDSDTPGVHVVSGQWNASENYQYAMTHPDAMRSEREGGNTWDETDLVAEAPNITGYTIVHTQVGRTDGLENNRYVSPWTQITNWRDEGWTPAWAHHGEKSNEDTTYVYQGVTNTYEVVDDSEGGCILSTQTLSGSPGSTINVGRTDLTFIIPTGYETAPGTTLPNADTTITFGNDGQLIIYHLQHQMRNVTHTSPLTPGTTTITNQPIHGAQYDDLNKTVTRTINVTTPTTSHTSTTTQTVNLYRDAQVDEVTGDVTYKPWNTGTWDAYTVPTIAGYTPSQSNVPSQVVDSTTNDSTVNITYSANEHTTQIKYVDTAGNAVKTDSISGDTDQTVTVNSTVPAGWQVVSGTIPATITFSETGYPDVTIQIVHKVDTVTHDHPLAPNATTPTNQPINGAHQNDLNRTVTRTIKVIAPTGISTTTLQTVHLYRDATVDEVTGYVTYGDWSTGNWDEFTDVPTYAGYTPTQASVPRVTVNSDTANTTIDITYTPKAQTAHIIYVDRGGHQVKTDTITGHTDETMSVNPVAPAGWQLVSGQTIPSTITFSATGHPDVTVQIEHKMDTVTHDHPLAPETKTPTNIVIDGAHEADLNKTITRTINVTNPVTNLTTTTTQQVQLYRDAIVDEVTGAVTYGDWNTGTWAAFTVPTVAGYTPSQSSVAEQPVTSATTDTTVNITYTASGHVTHINYVDSNGHTIKSDTISGNTGQTVNVNSTVPTGWKLVTGQSIPTTITFAADGHADVNVQIEHKTDTVTHDHPLAPGAKTPTNQPINGAHQSDLNKTVTRTINVTDPTTGRSTTTRQSANIYRNATVDEVTGNVTYGDWSTGNWAAFTVPTVAGYTPSQSTVPSQNVNGTTSDQNIDITYSASHQTTHIVYEDSANTVIKTDTVNGQTGQTVNTNSSVPTGWKLVSGQTVPSTITFRGASTRDTIVQIEHATTDVSHTSPVPEGGRTTTGQTIEGAHESDLNQTIVRTINVTTPDGRTTTTTQTATIYRDATYDEVTGEVTYGAWSTDSTGWTEFTPTTVDGFTASQADVPAVTVTNGQTPVTINIIYRPNVQTGVIQYVDGTTVVGTTTLSGSTGESITITPVIPDHYTEVSGQTIPTSVIATAHGIPTVTIYVQHSTNAIHDSKTITRTINVTDQNGHTTTTTQIVTLTRDGTHDAVTNTDSWGSWTSGSWDAFTVPTIAGYTPSQASVAAQAVNSDTYDATVNITYTAKDQTGQIVYIDVDNHNAQVGSTTLNGKTDANVAVHPVIPNHFVEVSGQTIPRTVTATADGIPTMTVYVRHATDSLNNSKDVTRTIKITNPDGTVRTTSQVAHLTRTGTHDEVTGNDNWNPWTNDTWAAFDTPTIAGYTPSVAHVDQQTVHENTRDTEVDITYTANDQSGQIVYVDVDNHNAQVGTTTLTGRTGESVTVTPTVPTNYEEVPGQRIPATVTATADGIPTVTIKVRHITSPVSDSKTITRTINVTDPSGRTTTTTQRATLTRTGTHDHVTNTDTWDAWSTGSWDAFTTPTIAGYTPSQTSIAAQAVNSNTIDTTINITYTANDQSVAYSFVDDDNGGRVVAHGTLSGKTDQTVNTGLSVPTNYKLAEGQTIPTTYEFAASGNQPIVIHLKHQTHSINDSKTFTRTINVTDPSGRTTTTTQRTTLTRTGTHDDVTNTDTWGAWSTGSWDAFTTPTIAGYTPSQASVPAQTVTSETKNTTVNITYTANEETATIHFVDDDNPAANIAPVVISGHPGEHVSLSPFIPTGYQLAPGESSTYTFTGANDQSQTIHLVHGHNSSSETKTVTRRIIEHLPGRAPRVINQTVTLTRTNTTDAVTGAITSHGSWSTGSWSAFTPDAVPDYTADPSSISAEDVTAETSDQTVDVNYISNTKNVSQAKTITETIHYRYSDGSQAAPDKVQTVTFTRHGLQHADGSVDWQAWDPAGSQILPAVDSPTIDGYHPDQASIPAQTVNEDSQDRTFTVTYAANSTPVNPNDHNHDHDNPTPVNPNNHDHDNPTPVNPNNHDHNNPTPVNPNDHNHSHQTPGTNIPGQPNANGQSNHGNAMIPKDEFGSGQSGQVNARNTMTGNQQGQQRLPQTGNQSSEAILGLVGIALASMLGMADHRKKDNY